MLAVWFLGAIAILLSYGAGSKKEVSHSTAGKLSSENVENNHSAPEAKIVGMSHESNSVDTKEVDGTVAVNKTQEIEHAESDARKALKVSSDEKTEAVVTILEGDVENLVNNKKVDQKTIMASVSSEETSQNKDKSETAEARAETVMDLDQSNTEEVLKMAREAYWNNGLDEAAQIYQQLIQLEPTVLEHKGELGNVYWRQGYPKKAAELYSEIAIPMIEEGNADRVANMIGFIGLFYPDRASIIHDRIQRVAGQNKNDQGK